jgi:hypothetical protein
MNHFFASSLFSLICLLSCLSPAKAEDIHGRSVENFSNSSNGAQMGSERICLFDGVCKRRMRRSWTFAHTQMIIGFGSFAIGVFIPLAYSLMGTLINQITGPAIGKPQIDLYWVPSIPFVGPVWALSIPFFQKREYYFLFIGSLSFQFLGLIMLVISCFSFRNQSKTSRHTSVDWSITPYATTRSLGMIVTKKF